MQPAAGAYWTGIAGPPKVRIPPIAHLGVAANNAIRMAAIEIRHHDLEF
jgi:hypothetical protein